MGLAPEVERELRSGLTGAGLPSDLIQAVFTAVNEMAAHYLAGHLRPAELQGGDFAEAVFRILEFLSDGSFTPLGRPLPAAPALMQRLQQSQLDDSLRIHVPRVLQAIYDIRNRRGVGHLAGTVTPNRSDAELIMACVKWILAEFIVLFHSATHDQAQALVDLVAARQLPVVENFEGTMRVISSRSVSLPEELLLLLLAAEPSNPSVSTLKEWTGSAPKRLSTAIGRLLDHKMVHRFVDGRIRLTSLGRARAEEALARLG